ncbi:MAG: DUF2155 domain-containing protein [Caulobacteraceae bacterium]|nr:DUF2155 domain-containing protein [Caulobacteraceae bacterium]
MSRLSTWAVCGGIALALGVTGLVKAQGGDPIGALLQPGAKPPGAVKPHEPAKATAPSPTKVEPEAPAPGAPVEEASDATAAEDLPAASSKPGPAKPIEPLKRPRYAIAVIQALDKVSAETLRFEAPVNQPIRYKSLVFIVRACETTASDETITDAAAHVEIISQPMGPDEKPKPGKSVFKGWMFSNSPGLNLFQHPVYDAWLIACKTATPSA